MCSAAASSLQYCSFGSLMADGRQCCFPLGGRGVKGGELAGGGECNVVIQLPGLHRVTVESKPL